MSEEPWRPSPDPEIFHDDTEYEVERITSEEIDLSGRRWLEIKWGQWQRQDGTNTTWQDDFDNKQVLDEWEKNLNDARHKLARIGLDIELLDSPTPNHLYRTIEAANALQEKRQKSHSANDSRYKSWETLKHIGSAGEAPRIRSSSRSKDSTPPSRSVPSKRPPLSSADDRQPKKSKTTVYTARQVLLHRWLRACMRARAPKLHIRNDVDNEEIPILDPDFEYLEDDYHYDNINLKDSDGEWLAGCECRGPCTEECDCVRMISDDDETHTFYENGLLAVERCGNVIVECNKLCACRKDLCGNRVVQQGRDIEIEIFRTADRRGWGARALKDLPKGKFLGVYTGCLILRKHALKLSEDHRSYTFDLDGLGNDADVPEDKKYSVDAHHHGNWTRFVNHSCGPNIQIYSVMWNTNSEMNRPYLAFITNKAIPARTEFTIDYAPGTDSSSKGKRRRPPGSKVCRCGAVDCRGWVAV